MVSGEECYCRDWHGCIMQQSIVGMENIQPYKFSDCSLNDYIDEFRDTRNMCLLNKPNEVSEKRVVDRSAWLVISSCYQWRAVMMLIINRSWSRCFRPPIRSRNAVTTSWRTTKSAIAVGSTTARRTTLVAIRSRANWSKKPNAQRLGPAVKIAR